jgi:molecular chaperone GrpE
MMDGSGMEDALKHSLVEQFRCYLEGIGEMPQPREAAGSEADLFTLFVELAALRTEVRTESRLVKEALDQFRDVFQIAQSSQGALEQELQSARERERAQERALLQPLLLDLLDLRDRLAAGLQTAPVPRPRWQAPWRRMRPPQNEPWQEGLNMTLRRLDRILQDRRVTPIDMLGRRFDPRLGRVVATRHVPGTDAGIVLEEVRAGFLWEDLPLRLAEVVVNKPDAGERL